MRTKTNAQVKGEMRVGTAGQTLTPGALRALVDIGTSRQGAVVGKGVSGAVLAELAAAGLIGQERGLTRSGGIRRDREVSRLMDELF